MDTVVKFASNSESQIDACVDHTRPSLAIEIEILKNAFLNAKRRGAKFRYVTEINRDNLSYCKELMKIVDELRHLAGIRGNFYISESQYIAPATLHEKGKPASQLIYSNVKEIVEHAQYVFDSFWSRARPADEVIKEIEEGTVHHETKIIDNSDDIIEEIRDMTEKSMELSTCLAPGGLQYSHNYFFELNKKLIEKQTRHKHRGIRYVSHINSENLKLAKIFSDHGIKLKHVKNLPPMSFSVSDKQVAATIEKMDGGRAVQSLLVSNEPNYIKHFRAMFEELWKNGTDGADRIENIEKGIDSEEIQIIQNSLDIQSKELELMKAATKEILIIHPTANAFHRQDIEGAMHLINQVAAKGVKVKIITPMDDLLRDKIRQLKQKKRGQLLEIRGVEQLSQTKVKILIVDRRFSFTVEVKKDTPLTSDESLGFATFSNSKATVLSYVSIFETLWLQRELYENLAESNERLAAAIEELKAHDILQREFINIAAHELRSPIQPVLSLSDILQSKIKDSEQLELVSRIVRNAQKLKKLSDDILDVARIESRSLKLNVEIFSLNDVILRCIQERTNQIREPVGNVKIDYTANQSDLLVRADKGRLTQAIFNLLDNALKFTNEGTIFITLNHLGGKDVSLSVKDTGTGIDPQISLRLFSKFASKSELGGTGLGLFITKSIILAHRGKIWAENNADGRGATFSAILPIASTS